MPAPCVRFRLLAGCFDAHPTHLPRVCALVLTGRLKWVLAGVGCFAVFWSGEDVQGLSYAYYAPPFVVAPAARVPFACFCALCRSRQHALSCLTCDLIWCDLASWLRSGCNLIPRVPLTFHEGLKSRVWWQVLAVYIYTHNRQQLLSPVSCGARFRSLLPCTRHRVCLFHTARGTKGVGINNPKFGTPHHQIPSTAL